ncbi:Heterokaryon incompatibility protein 6 OR allele [Lachnellula suecica]|uniref:Heterokaryon incompatibility protein 6 OR allele n=1 Tax=Lachnellula suecica TaxID=602035 RepID=A0A8T9CKU4_9HELO|nr:Heterokaryon incompatibility protein 6 OR allele [Lachnellula suecica]
MDTSFKYESLDLSKDEIRLVVIEAGHSTEPLTGRIFNVSLDEAPQYEALSYEWGSPVSDSNEVTGDIEINGQLFQLRPNLYAALRHLRSSANDLTIWIDAICIDQNNIEERNSQVLKMRLIYSLAKEVQVWLGEAKESSDLAFQFMRDLAVLSGVDDSKHLIDEKFDDPQTLPLFKASAALFSRSYWRRIWVVQEVASAKKTTVHCGPETLPWPEVSAAAKVLRDNYPKLTLIFPSNSLLTGDLTAKGPSTLLKRKTPLTETGDPKFGLENLLLTHRFKSATDPRDLVYALLGLSTAHNDPDFILDYSRSLEDVYTDVVKYILKSSGCLNIICYGLNNGFPDPRPSWVPDWTMRPIPSWNYLQRKSRHDKHIPRGYQITPSISADGKILEAAGIRVGTIQHFGAKYNFDFKTRVDVLVAIKNFHAWRELLLSVKGNDLEAQKAFGRSLFCDSYYMEEDFTFERVDICLETLGAFASLSQRLLPEYPIDDSLKAYLERFNAYATLHGLDVQKTDASWVISISETTIRRSLFISEEGLVGTASNQVTEDDLICILFGCSFPVVLRPVEGGFVLIGEAYIDGMMGKLPIEGLKSGKYREEKFCIH